MKILRTTIMVLVQDFCVRSRSLFMNLIKLDGPDLHQIRYEIIRQEQIGLSDTNYRVQINLNSETLASIQMIDKDSGEILIEAPRMYNNCFEQHLHYFAIILAVVMNSICDIPGESNLSFSGSLSQCLIVSILTNSRFKASPIDGLNFAIKMDRFETRFNLQQVIKKFHSEYVIDELFDYSFANSRAVDNFFRSQNEEKQHAA